MSAATRTESPHISRSVNSVEPERRRVPLTSRMQARGASLPPRDNGRAADQAAAGRRGRRPDGVSTFESSSVNTASKKTNKPECRCTRSNCSRGEPVTTAIRTFPCRASRFRARPPQGHARLHPFPPDPVPFVDHGPNPFREFRGTLRCPGSCGLLPGKSGPNAGRKNRAFSGKGFPRHFKKRRFGVHQNAVVVEQDGFDPLSIHRDSQEVSPSLLVQRIVYI